MLAKRFHSPFLLIQPFSRREHILIAMERSQQPEETGFAIALEPIEQIRHLPGVSGINLMSVGWESILPRLVQEAALSSRVAKSEMVAESDLSSEYALLDSMLETIQVGRA